jgi:hypothetical protein
VKLFYSDDQKFILELTESELLIMKACLRESFAAIHRDAFPLRIGATMEVVDRLAEEFTVQARSLGVEE